MSSLRLALKQSLQESGGGSFSSGHGDKKKRKKKKIGSNGSGGSGSIGNGTGNGTKKARREGDSAAKRKRGRPRKHHPRSQHDDDDDDVTLGEDQPRRTDRRRDRPRTSKHTIDDEDDEDDDEFYSENEFSYTEEYSEDYDDDSDEDDDDNCEDIEDDDGDSPHRSRSRSRAPDDDHEEEGEEDETMPSDEDDLYPQPSNGPTKSTSYESQNIASSTTATTVSETNDGKGKSDGNSDHLVQQQPDRSDVQKSKNTTLNGSSSEPKSANGNESIPSKTAVLDEMLRKKFKLQKLKKKLEKSQNKAASKIQTQWKKKVSTKISSQPTESKAQKHPSALTVAAAGITTSTTSSIVIKEKVRDSKGDDTRSTSPNLVGGTSATLKSSSAGIDSQQNIPRGKDELISAVTTNETLSSFTKQIISEPAKTTTTSSTSSAAAGDRDNTVNTGDGEDQVVQAKKKKKKKKNTNGVVPAPTREVKQWRDNMLEKKSRKYIQVGMRIKVRFAISVKRDGQLVEKKKFYGGEVTDISKKRTKIKIKYDDGTSEVSKFPDHDVYVDAVDNGEHSVSADKFLPPSQDQLEEAIGDETMTSEEQEEGEITNPPSAAVVVVATETEEGEVEEVTKPKACHVESSESSDSRTTLKQSSDDITPSENELGSAKTPMDVPSTPPPVTSLTSLSKDEKTTDAVESSSNSINGEDDVQIEIAPSQSQEEGELSPGITVSKSSENAPEEQRNESIRLTVESKLLPTTALLPSAVRSEKATLEPIKFAVDNSFPIKSEGDALIPDVDKSNEKSVPDIPPKPKKLSIRIPSNSLASMKNFSSSPKSNGSVRSPKIVISSSNLAAASKAVNDILKDNLEAKKELASKRKRLPDKAAPSLDVAPGQEPPTKRRIKVAIGKNLPEIASLKSQPTNDNAASKAALLPLQETEEGLVYEEFAPIPEEPATAGETKKKKKRADRARSPKPKSPLPIPEPDKIKIKSISNPSEASSGSVTPKQQKIGSKISAFSAKKLIVAEDSVTSGPKQTTLKVSISAESLSGSVLLRNCRKAAEEAKEKLSVKQKAKLSAKEPKEKEIASLESGKKKKKRRREKEAEDHGEDSELEHGEHELEWVQCDDCKKWRVLPDNIKAASLPDLWYCRMNVYDPKRSKCEAPEQNMKQLLKERKRRAKKRAKREAELAAESQQEKGTKKIKQQEDETPKATTTTTTTTTATTTTTKKKSKQEKLLAVAGSTPRSASPKPPKSAKALGGKSRESAAETKKAIAEAKKANHEGNKKSKIVVEEQPNPTDSGSDTQRDVKKKGKKVKKEIQDNSDNQDADDSKKAGKKRGRPSRNQTSSSSTCTTVPPTSSEKKDDDEDNVEWVQCDKCEKWRKLPPHISTDELPEEWNCSMNTWNPNSASCDAAEDKTDAHHQEVGATEWQLRQTHAGKYSYRQMIFGPGARKHNRPLSERSRAAESLFVQLNTDEEQTHPITQYTKSSAFLPRLSNFQKNNANEDNTLGIFDVLRHSNLWEDLRTMDMKPAKVLSSSTSNLNIPGQKLKTYECLSDEIKHAMQDVVLQTLEFGCLTGNEIVGKAQWFPYETSIKGVAGIRGYCNEDIIIHTLLDLVKDSLVEMATVRDPIRPVSQWVPRYRRVGTRRAFEAVEAIKASRCMKIAKPWKQRSSKNTTTTEWVTGQKAN